MANKIQVRRGLKSKLPTLAVGEPALTTDTKEVYIGHTDGNIGIATTSQLAETWNNGNSPSILSANGYQKLANGFIIQWGAETIPAAGGAVIFPIAFPNTVFNITALALDTGGGTVAVSYTVADNSQMTLKHSGAGSISIVWSTMGY